MSRAEPESLPRLLRRTEDRWRQVESAPSAADTSQSLAPARRLLDASRWIVDSLERLAQGRAQAEGVASFRQSLGQAVALYDPDSRERKALDLLRPSHVPLTPTILNQLAQLARQQLEGVLKALDTHTHAALALQSMLDEPAAAVPVPLEPTLDEDDEDEKAPPRKRLVPGAGRHAREQPEVEVEELEAHDVVDDVSNAMQEEGLHLKFSPLVWQDAVTQSWKWAVFVDAASGVYDQMETKLYEFPTEAEAQQSLDQFIDRVDQSAHPHDVLLERAMLAWRQLNASQACQHIQGTETLHITDPTTHSTQRYVIVFCTYGAPQLKDHPAYQQLVHLGTGQSVEPLLQTLETHIRTRAGRRWAVLRTAALGEQLARKMTMGLYGFIPCTAATGIVPIIGLWYFALRFPPETTEEQVTQAEDTIFQSMDTMSPLA